MTSEHGRDSGLGERGTIAAACSDNCRKMLCSVAQPERAPFWRRLQEDALLSCAIRKSTFPVAPAVEVPASLAALSSVYGLWALLGPGRAACLPRQLSVMAEELPSAQHTGNRRRQTRSLDYRNTQLANELPSSHNEQASKCRQNWWCLLQVGKSSQTSQQGTKLLLKAIKELVLTAAIAVLHSGSCTRGDPIWGRCRPGRPVQRPTRAALLARCLPKARIMRTCRIFKAFLLSWLQRVPQNYPCQLMHSVMK